MNMKNVLNNVLNSGSDWQDFIDPDTLQQYLGKGMDFLYSDERIEDGFQGMSNSNDQPDKPVRSF